MTKQISIGKDPLVFSKQTSGGGINCPPCETTPTPTPTVVCLTVNLKSEIACDSYDVIDSMKSVSVDKLTDAVVTDTSIILSGYSSCNSIITSSNISESILAKTKLVTKTENNITTKFFDLDTSFSINGKVNSAFYDTTNLKVASKFSCVINQVASGQTKIIAAGESGYKPLIARYLASGSIDRTFGLNNGYVTLETLDNNKIRLINVFAVSLQTDNKIIVFCNGYDLINKHSVCIAVRLTNSGVVDTTFNDNIGYLSFRSLLPEFDGNKIVGKSIKKYGNEIYIIFESFSSAKRNTIIVVKYLLNESKIDNTFGSSGYLYTNINNKDTYYQTLFVRKVGSIDTLNIVANGENKSLTIFKYLSNGTKPELTTMDLKDLVIDNQIFKVANDINPSDVRSLTVSFLNSPCDELDMTDYLILPLNINILSNPIDTIGGSSRNLLHWLEKQSLVTGNFEYSRLSYRDCVALPCDRQPEDSNGTLNVLERSIKKYNTSSRILFGYLKISSDLSSVTAVKIDRFDKLVPHNLLKKITKLDNNYVAVGFSGDNTNSTLNIKTITFDNNQLALGPFLGDIGGRIDFGDSCSTLTEDSVFVGVEECPCAPGPTPTPTPTPLLPTSDLYISSIVDKCIGDSPALSISWKKNKQALQGSYVLQVVRNTVEKPEILASTFDVASDTEENTLDILLTGVDASLNNKTCIASILDSVGNVVSSKIFVFIIRNCS
jgi:hypothetical protein